MATLEGKLDAAGCRFGIVVSKYNEFVTSRLLAGAMDVLVEAGADKDAIDVAYVPGAYELPLIAREFGKSGRYDAVICLGAGLAVGLAARLFEARVEEAVAQGARVLTGNVRRGHRGSLVMRPSVVGIEVELVRRDGRTHAERRVRRGVGLG